MSKVVSLICSHNSRIQCLLDKFSSEKRTKKIRFQNCAVLRMSIKTSNCSVTLVYSGELSPEEKEKVSIKRPYYAIGVKSGYEFFTPFEFKPNKLGLTIPKDKEYVFYIVRHGQAEHNVKNSMGFSSTMGMKYDTNLTEDGKKQAVNAAIKLGDILTEYGDDKIDVFFSSDLVRSRQTIQTIQTMLSELTPPLTENPTPIELSDSESSLSPSPIPLPNKMIVLPCASEVETVGDGTGNCDSANAIGGIARENYPNCTKYGIDKLDSPCTSIDNFTFDWEFYLGFYNDLTRRDYMNPMNRFKTRKHCRDTNMISCAIEYLNQSQQSHMSVTPGGAKRRKATKKRTRKTKTKKRLYKMKTKRRR